MDNQEIIAQIDKIVSSSLEKDGFELVELIYRREGKNLVLRLLVDRLEGRITMDDCAALNHRLGQLLDGQEIISNRYVLEVSSPGLDRRLLTQKDFLRCLNKRVVFFLKDLINGKCQWQGLISRVDEASVFIDTSNDAESSPSGQILEIPLIKINKATLII